MEGLVAIVLIFGLPIITILCAAYAYVKKRQWAHLERVKMIENGLITSEEDIRRAEKALDAERPFDWGALLFYPLVFYLVLLVMAYMVFTLFYMIMIHSPENSGHFLAWTLLGMVATGVLMVLIRVAPALKRYGIYLLAGVLFLCLMWTALFVRQLTNVSIEQVKNKIKSQITAEWNMNMSPDSSGNGNDSGSIQLKIGGNKGDKGKVIVR
jgi:hypothetical protein